MPSPGCDERVSPWVNSSNTRGSNSGDIPIPESTTEIETCRMAAPAGGVMLAEIRTEPPLL